MIWSVLFIVFVFFCMFALAVWVSTESQKLLADEERWLTKRLSKKKWEIVHGGSRLGQLQLYVSCIREFSRWRHIQPLAIHKSNQRRAWIFQVLKKNVAAFVIWARDFDFPQITLKNKLYLKPLEGRKSNAEIEKRFPELCKEWVVQFECHEQLGGRELFAAIQDPLMKIQNVLRDNRGAFNKIEFAENYLAIIRATFDQNDFSQFIKDTRSVLLALAQPDLFSQTERSSKQNND